MVIFSLLALSCLILPSSGSWVPPAWRSAQATGETSSPESALSLNVTFWPDSVCGNRFAVYPVGLEVHGPPNASFELSAWLYNGGQLAQVWSPRQQTFRWADYMDIQLDMQGHWSGIRFLQVKGQVKPESTHYLKARLRNATVSLEAKLEDWQLWEPTRCVTLTGHVGNGSSPWEMAPVVLRDGSGQVVAANLSLATPWTPTGTPGAYRLAAPPGNYSLELHQPDTQSGLDLSATSLIDHTVELKANLTTLDLGWQGPRPANASQRRLVIYELAPDTYLSDEPDEYLALWNPTSVTLDLGGWSIHDGLNTAVLPRATSIGPLGRLSLARNASAYELAWGQPPDLEMRLPGNTRTTMLGSALRLANAGGDLSLWDATGRLVDRVLYGGVTREGPGWTGEALTAPEEGQVLVRWTRADSNTSADWQGAWRDLRTGQSRWPQVTCDFAAGQAFVSPDSSYRALTRLIDNATTSLELSLYSFTSPWLALRLANASARGVSVSVHLEGTPVGGLTNDSRWAAHTVAAAGAQVRLLARDPATDTPARYLNDHAKYLLIDHRYVVVMSENWNRRGISVEPSQGNRGWGLSLDSPALARELSEVFRLDFDLDRLDLRSWGEGTFTLPAGVKANWSLGQGSYLPRFQPGKVGPGRATLLLSPDNLMAPEGLLDLLNQATESLWVQQAALPLTWWGRQSPYLEVLLEAARRSVSVRVILDGGLIYSREDNQLTVDHLNGLARAEGLDLEARLFPGEPLLKVHNKGALVDGRYVLVGSTNWVRAAAMDNREVSLWVDSEAAAAYYGAVFQWDWELSAPRVPDQGNLDTPGFQLETLIWVAILVACRSRAGSRRPAVVTARDTTATA